MDNPDCKNCHKAGLAILPVRYAVVPKAMPNKLPGALKAPGVREIELQKHHYALRTLRQGFVYLFYEKRWLPGSDWQGNLIRSYEVYSVAENGTLWRQANSFAVQPVQQPVCKDTAHQIPASVIAIANPEKSGLVWIAFSEHQWSLETLDAYGNDAALRARRMQKVDPASWIGSKQHDHGIEAVGQSLREIVEYAIREPEEIQAPEAEPPVSKDDGSYLPAVLKRVTTRYPLARREKQLTATLECMKAIGKVDPEKPPHPPMVLALWDAIGVTHELNGFRNEPAGRIQQYGQERALEISAMSAIDGLKKALQQKAGDAQQDLQDHTRSGSSGAYDTASLHQRRTQAATLAEPRRGQELEVCNILDHWAQQQAPSYYRGRLETANLSPEPRRSQEIASLQTEVNDFLTRREKNAAANIEDARTEAWSHYEPKIDPERLKHFKEQLEAFAGAADKLVDERTDDLLAWLKSQPLLDTLTEYHSNYVADGVAFEDKIGVAILGLGSSPKGAEKLKKWVEEAKATEKNLIWRAIALNQTLAITDLNQALQEAKQHKGARTLATTLDWTGYTAKSLKAFADTHKKASSIYTANDTASSAKGSTAFGARIQPINSRNIDYLAMTVGDTVIRYFRIDGLADYVSEKIIQHVFSIRAFVNPADSANLILTQARNEELARQQTLQRLRSGKTFLATDQPAVKSIQAQSLETAWTEFKTKNSGAANALRDSRLAVVVMLVEGVNFFKLMGDCYRKNDGKSWWSLGASAMTITSLLFDVATVAAKAVFELDAKAPAIRLPGAESWSYQRLKLYGGLLSAGATAIGVYFDWEDGGKAWARGYHTLGGLYIFKAAAGATGAGLTLAATFTYSAPFIGRLTGSAALGTAVGNVGLRAAAIIGKRILMMSAGAWITVGTFTIQVFIWKFTDNELQSWASQCAFGLKRNAAWNRKTQETELQAALNAVGVE